MHNPREPFPTEPGDVSCERHGWSNAGAGGHLVLQQGLRAGRLLPGPPDRPPIDPHERPRTGGFSKLAAFPANIGALRKREGPSDTRHSLDLYVVFLTVSPRLPDFAHHHALTFPP